MDDAILHIENLSHRYGTDWAIRDLNLTLETGGIVGLLGQNGAGKSTMMNIICGVLYQTKGEVFIDGINIREDQIRTKKLIGFLPQQAPVYHEFTVNEYLKFCAGLRNMPKDKIPAALEAVKETCGISHFSNRLIGNLSGGYRQRVGIAQAIIHDPKIVIMDEPTNGLDPNQILNVRNLIKKIAKTKFVILSSHVLGEVQAICSHIVMIDSGRFVFNGTMDQFNEYSEPQTIVLTMENMPSDDTFLALGNVNEVLRVTEKQVRLKFSGGKEIAETLIEAGRQGEWRIREINFDRNTLEETFALLSIKKNV